VRGLGEEWPSVGTQHKGPVPLLGHTDPRYIYTLGRAQQKPIRGLKNEKDDPEKVNAHLSTRKEKPKRGEVGISAKGKTGCCGCEHLGCLRGHRRIKFDCEKICLTKPGGLLRVAAVVVSDGRTAREL